MQSIQSTVLGTLQRAQRFLDDNAAALGPSITQSATRSTLDQAITALLRVRRSPLPPPQISSHRLLSPSPSHVSI